MARYEKGIRLCALALFLPVVLTVALALSGARGHLIPTDADASHPGDAVALAMLAGFALVVVAVLGAAALLWRKGAAPLADHQRLITEVDEDR